MTINKSDIQRRRKIERAHQEEEIKKIKEKQDYIDAFKNWKEDGIALAVDLNAKFDNEIKFVSDLQKLIKHLNQFAFGREFLRGENRFLVKAVIEEGSLGTNLHCHMMIYGLDKTRRTLYELTDYIRKEWANIINIKNPDSSMIHIETINDEPNAPDSKGYYQIKYLNYRRITEEGKSLLL